MKCFKSFFVILSVLILFACRPEIEDSYPELDVFIYDFPQIFEVFWHGMNRNYLYWDIEPTSPYWDSTLGKLTSGERSSISSDPMVFWDIIHDHYKLKFEALGVFNNKDSLGYTDAANTAHEYFKDMTSGLRDGNFRIVFENKEDIIPGLKRRLENLNSESPYRASGVFSCSDLSKEIANLGDNDAVYYKTYNYVDEVISKNFYECEYSIDLSGFRIIRGKKTSPDNEIIIYLSYNNGSIFDYTREEDGNSEIIEIYEKYLSDLKEQEVKGIILDLRGNTGGSLQDVSFFWSRIVSASLVFSETRAKSGEGRLDYGSWIQNRIRPAPAVEAALKNKDAKIVLLVDGGTSSAAELMTMAAKAHKTGYVIGTKTMGAVGVSAAAGKNTAYNGGGFEMNHFIKYASGAEVQIRGAADKTVYEGVGIEPDKKVDMDWPEFYGMDGVEPADAQLEAAIEYINSVDD